jgi:hypothetical protein
VTDNSSIGDFQPDKVRAEMIGILANRAMQFTDWSTRICLVPVREVKDRAVGVLNGTRARTDEHGSRLSDLPHHNAMQYTEDTLINRIVRTTSSPLLNP